MVRSVGSVGELPQAAWDALDHGPSPFLKAGFLRALEASGSIDPATPTGFGPKKQRSGWTSIYLLAEGRLINLAAAEGHPASVMDMSFSTQALCAEWVVKAGKKLDVTVHDVPAEIEDWVSRLKLESMGMRIDELTEEQKEYLSSWKIGT